MPFSVSIFRKGASAQKNTCENAPLALEQNANETHEQDRVSHAPLAR